METPNNFCFKEINEEEKKYKFKNVLESKLFKRLQNYLLNNNFIIDNKTLKKGNNNFWLFTISPEIMKIYSVNSYKIKISENFKNILKKNDEYYSNINLIKNFNDSIWKTINQENQEKMKKYLEKIYGKKYQKRRIRI